MSTTIIIIDLPKYKGNRIKLIIKQTTKRRPIIADEINKSIIFYRTQTRDYYLFSFSEIRKGKPCVSHQNYPFGIASNYRSYYHFTLSLQSKD